MSNCGETMLHHGRGRVDERFAIVPKNAWGIPFGATSKVWHVERGVAHPLGLFPRWLPPLVAAPRGVNESCEQSLR